MKLFWILFYPFSKNALKGRDACSEAFQCSQSLQIPYQNSVLKSSYSDSIDPRTPFNTLLGEDAKQAPAIFKAATKIMFNNEAEPFRDQINALLDIAVAEGIKNPGGDPSSWLDLSTLHLSAAAFCYENLYRQNMRLRFQHAKSDEEVRALERLDVMLTMFVAKEKRQRNRLVVSEILNAAIEGPEALDKCLEERATAGHLTLPPPAHGMDSGRDDGSLVGYLRQLVLAEERKSMAMNPHDSDYMGGFNQGQEQQEAMLDQLVKGVAGGSGTPLLRILRIVKDRVEAEATLHRKPEVKLLWKLLRQPDRKEREAEIRRSPVMMARERLEDLAMAAREGVEYFKKLEGQVALRRSRNFPEDSKERMQSIYDICNIILDEMISV